MAPFKLDTNIPFVRQLALPTVPSALARAFLLNCRSGGPGVYDVLKANFDAAYLGNRAPLPISVTSEFLSVAGNRAGLSKFIGGCRLQGRGRCCTAAGAALALLPLTSLLCCCRRAAEGAAAATQLCKAGSGS